MYSSDLYVLSWSVREALTPSLSEFATNRICEEHLIQKFPAKSKLSMDYNFNLNKTSAHYSGSILLANWQDCMKTSLQNYAVAGRK